jgi:hypothetical protein
MPALAERWQTRVKSASLAVLLPDSRRQSFLPGRRLRWVRRGDKTVPRKRRFSASGGNRASCKHCHWPTGPRRLAHVTAGLPGIEESVFSTTVAAVPGEAGRRDRRVAQTLTAPASGTRYLPVPWQDRKECPRRPSGRRRCCKERCPALDVSCARAGRRMGPSGWRVDARR